MNESLIKLNSRTKSGYIKRQIVSYCRHEGKNSIPEMAKKLEYSVPTVTKYINELCDEGFLLDYGKIETKTEGRHPNAYGVNPDSCYFMGVDIRWFSLNIGLINFSGEFLKLSMDDSFRFENTPEMFEKVCDAVKAFIEGVKNDKSKRIDVNKIININFNISGRVNPETGYSYSIFNFGGETPLASTFSEKIGYNVCIDNDTRAMTYGEFRRYYPGKQTNMLFINVGWGIGIGIIANGELYRGKSGFAGEFGHMSVFDNEILCHCGKKGCLETELSGAALLRKVKERINDGSLSCLSKSLTEGKLISIHNVVDAIVEKEDILCIEMLENMGAELGKQIANLINLFNPDYVVIGGVLAETGDYLLQPIKASIRKYSLSIVSNDTKVVVSKLQNKSGVLGACLLALDNVFEK